MPLGPSSHRSPRSAYSLAVVGLLETGDCHSPCQYFIVVDFDVSRRLSGS